MPSTRTRQGDRWPPVNKLKLSPAQICALMDSYLDIIGEPLGRIVDRRLIPSLVNQGLMLPSGMLTRRGVDAHVRASGKTASKVACARVRRAEREEATRAATVEVLRAAGCPLRDGLFLLPVEPGSLHEVVRLIRLEVERKTKDGQMDHVQILHEALAKIENSGGEDHGRQ